MSNQSRSLPLAVADAVDSAMGLVCTLPAADRTEWRASVHAVLAQAQSWTELETGIECAFENSDAMARALLDLVLAERICCSQFRYSIRFAAKHEPIELRVEASGPLVWPLKNLFMASLKPRDIVAVRQPDAQSVSGGRTKRARARAVAAVGPAACVASCISIPGLVAASAAFGLGVLRNGRLHVLPGISWTVSGRTIFGLFAVSAMLVCYAFEARNHWFILGFAVACGLGSVYGFLQGAWPFGLVEAVWAAVAMRRWTARRF